LNVVALLALFTHNKQQPQICSMAQPAYVTAGKSLSHQLRAALLGDAETSHADDYTQSGIMVPAYEDAHHTKGPELHSTARALYPELADDTVVMKPELDRSPRALSPPPVYAHTHELSSDTGSRSELAGTYAARAGVGSAVAIPTLYNQLTSLHTRGNQLEQLGLGKAAVARDRERR
jgi:hypothetical protein